MLFPIRLIGDCAKAAVLVPSQESHMLEPWINIQTGEATLNIKLGKDALNQLFLLAEDLARAIDAQKMLR
jgi:hypothetical protein